MRLKNRLRGKPGVAFAPERVAAAAGAFRASSCLGQAQELDKRDAEPQQNHRLSERSMANATDHATKYASECPLPGGVEQYFDTLVSLLRYIRDNNVLPEDLSKWMFDTFPNASGQIAVNGYISVLSRLGLWSQQDNLIRLTPDGTAVVTKAETAPAEARRMVIEIKYRD